MTLHGYKRPGIGYIHSNCFGEEWPPFELSSEGTFAYADNLEDHKKYLDTRLDKLKGGEAITFTPLSGKPQVKAEMNPREWEKALSLEIHTTEQAISTLKMDVTRLRRHGHSWKLEPLPVEGGEIKTRSLV